ncbi:MAG TPA: YfhH family protein [Pseudogracilibacillus sp.]|nr:YfhH family protein [Pseudogracilibacillus sp.]
MRFSDYSLEQIREELGKLKEQALKAEQLGNLSELSVIERKMQMLASYQLNPSDYQADEIYSLSGDPGYTFQITYIEGVMAWGHKINLLGEMQDKEIALPLSLLEEKKDK